MKMLLLLLLWLAGGSSAFAQKPDEVYLQIYQAMTEADALKANGETSRAIQKYQEAQTALQHLQAAQPDWNQKVVQFKLISVTQKLAALGVASTITTTPEPPASAQPPLVAPVAGKTSLPSPQLAEAKASPDYAISPPPGLKILSRKNWKAKPPVASMIPHTPAAITLHHTATKQNPKKSLVEKLQSLQAYSQREATLESGKKKPAWPDVPYHFYVAVDGEIGEGCDINFAGETNTEYDSTGHILVCLEGNFENETPTEAQMKNTQALVRWLAKKYEVPPHKISAHKDHAKTACPGKNLYAELKNLRSHSQDQ